MTDRFYQIGLEAEDGVFKTSYETANDMMSHPRSPFPPGYSGHQPGARTKFGYSTPGPDPWRLSHPELYGDAGSHLRRGVLAMTRTQVNDDTETFKNYDMAASLKHKGIHTPKTALSIDLNKSQSSPVLPMMNRKRLSEVPQPIQRLEDATYTYFVPDSLKHERKEKLPIHILSKIHKEKKVTMPYSGAGTGFRTTVGECDWWPTDDDRKRSTYSIQFAKPAFRVSPLKVAGSLSAIAN